MSGDTNGTSNARDAERQVQRQIVLSEEGRRQIIRYFESLRRIHARLRIEGIVVEDDDQVAFDSGQNG